MKKAVWLWLITMLAGTALVGLAEATPAAAAKIPAPPKAPPVKPLILNATLIANPALTVAPLKLARGGTGIASFKDVPGVAKKVNVTVTLPEDPNATVTVFIDGLADGTIILNPLGFGVLNLISGGGKAFDPIVNAVHVGSTVVVKTADGLVLLSGTFK